MTNLHKALYSFWSQFGVPAYIKDHVPDDATFPYITFEVDKPCALQSVVLTAFNWHKAPANGGVNLMSKRAEMLDKIAEKIPVGGVRIPVNGGTAVLYRNTAGFQSYYDDPEDRSVLGGRTSYILQYFA